MAGLLVGVEDRAVDATADPNPLAEGVVGRGLGGGAVGQGLETTGVVVAGGDGGITGGVTRSVIPVRAGEGAGDAADPIGRRRDRVGGGSGAGLGQAVAVGIVGPTSRDCRAGAAGQAIEAVIPVGPV